MKDLGFKKLTQDTWLAPDRTLSTFARVTDDGKVVRISPKEWLDRILEPRLNESVPIEVTRLYEVARSAMAYGCFFYPLFSLAKEQLYRVAEAAIRRKCQDMRAPRRHQKSFKRMIEFLVQQKTIPKQQKYLWDVTRELRNIYSHPDNQSINIPAATTATLTAMAHKVNSLFSRQTSDDAPHEGGFRDSQ